MLRLLGLAVLALLTSVQASAGLASATCAGADPAITSVVVTSTTTSSDVNEYHVSGKVVNVGHVAQASNVLQSVDIYDQQNKADAKSIPPLKPGQSYTFSYVYTRSSEAGAGTTQLTFQLDLHHTPSPGPQNCSTSNDKYVLTV